MSVPEQLAAIHKRALALVEDQYQLLNQLVFPALAAQGIQFVNAKTATAKQRDWLADYFAKEVEPVLTPLGLDPARPFPRIQNKSLNFIVRLSGKDAFGRDAELAVVQVPRSLPRIIRLPQSQRVRADAFRVPLDGHLDLRRAAVQRHESGRRLAVPRDAQQRSVRRRRRSGQPAARRRGRARAAPLRRGRAPGNFARLSGGHHRLPAASLRARPRTICTRSTARSTSIA